MFWTWRPKLPLLTPNALIVARGWNLWEEGKLSNARDVTIALRNQRRSPLEEYVTWEKDYTLHLQGLNDIWQNHTADMEMRNPLNLIWWLKTGTPHSLERASLLMLFCFEYLTENAVQFFSALDFCEQILFSFQNSTHGFIGSSPFQFSPNHSVVF